MTNINMGDTAQPSSDELKTCLRVLRMIANESVGERSSEIEQVRHQVVSIAKAYSF